MAELDTHLTDLPIDADPEPEGPTNAEEILSQLGQNVSFDYSPEPLYLETEVLIPEEFDGDDRDVTPLSEEGREALMNLDQVLTKADVAGRRIEIEQAWKANHYDRGYQFLLHHRSGGWTMPGQGTSYSPGNQKTLSNVYQTNVYGEKGEIITAALAREVPKVEFFPANSEHPPDQDMADVSDDLKDIWAKNNDLLKLIQNTAKIFWNSDRVMYWTRYELNGEEYGYEETDEPVVAEDEMNPPPDGTGTEAATQYEIKNESPVEKAAVRRPRGRVITSCHDKMAHKVPLVADDQAEMMGVYVCRDFDVSVLKARYFWMKDKIRGGGDGTGEAELDRVARENVRQAVPGSYITGDSINRHSVEKHTWIRRSFFYDDSVKDHVREELLAKFPDGALLVKAATDFVFARNECIDDHVVIGHPFPGQGQNRRSLGESLLPIQDYINELVMLILDFAKRTVPKKWMDAEAFNIEAIRGQKNIPGTIGGFLSQPGKTVEQLIFVEPTPAAQPWLFALIQWAIGALSEQISGALPSMFGAQISGQVGSEGVAIQRDQALQRVGCPWNSIQAMIACAARQAVMLTAKCANKDINDVIPGRGRISVKLNNLKGAVLCYPEANPEFPESWAQKETRMTELLDKALASPDAPTSQMILDPRNLKQFQSVLRLKDFVIKGAMSVIKQEAELEILLRSGPQPNPQKMQLKQTIETATQGLAQHVMAMQQGQGTPQMQQEMQQAPVMLNQLEQQMQGMPDQLSTVAVRGDGSEDDSVEASILFDWMNGPDGRKFEYGSPEQKAAFANVHLHWTEHQASAKKLAAQNAPPPPPPRVSFSVAADKMPPPEQADIMTAGGIQANPADFAMEDKLNVNADIAKKVIPDTVWAQQLHNKSGDEKSPPSQEPTQNPPGKK
jgi:hypothetical protein